MTRRKIQQNTHHLTPYLASIQIGKKENNGVLNTKLRRTGMIKPNVCYIKWESISQRAKGGIRLQLFQIEHLIL